jgi:hypothetical protein
MFKLIDYSLIFVIVMCPYRFIMESHLYFYPSMLLSYSRLVILCASLSVLLHFQSAHMPTLFTLLFCECYFYGQQMVINCFCYICLDSVLHKLELERGWKHTLRWLH